MTGYTNSGIISKLYRNDSLLLLFSFSSDYETPQNTLTYNLDIDINNIKFKSSMSDLESGYRKIVGSGNNGFLNNYNIYIPGFGNLPQEEKTLSWKVQAVDQCFAGSEFASSPDLILSSPRDLILSSNDLMTDTDVLKWEYVNVDLTDHYVIQIDDNRVTIFSEEPGTFLFCRTMYYPPSSISIEAESDSVTATGSVKKNRDE